MELSDGKKVDSSWILSADDLKKDLKIESDKVKDLSGWNSYNNKYAYQSFDVTIEIESTEVNNRDDLKVFSDVFTLTAWQKQK